MTTTPDVPEDAPRTSIQFSIALALAYLAVVLGQMSHHIMWRDELHPWQVIRPCKSIPEAALALRYDGVPPLWNGIVYLLTRVFDDPRSLQVVHALISTTVVFVFARWAPFTKPLKILFPLGYFALYEYGVIARSYSLLFLLLLIACVIISRRPYNFWALLTVLFLLMQTSVWGAGFAVALFGYALYKRQATRWEIGWGCAVLLAGLALCIASITPGPGRYFAARWPNAPFSQRFPEVLATIWEGMAPIPQWNRHFWNTNILDGFVWLEALLGILVFSLMIESLRRDRGVLWLFIVGAVGLLGFAYIFPGVTRHHGHLFMLLVVCSWLAGRSSPLLTSVLSLHVITGIGVAIAALTMPFSDSKRISQYLQTNFDLNQVTLMGIPDYSTSPESQWLRRPIYFPEMRKFARVNTQSDADRPGIKLRRLLPVIASVMEQENKPALLISASGFKPWDQDCVVPVNPDLEASPKVRIKVLPTFDDGIVETESALLYLITFE